MVRAPLGSRQFSDGSNMSDAQMTAPAGKSLFARAMRGSAFTAAAYALTQVMRLGSNLILTRLLAPDAFGVMALVSVVLLVSTQY